MKVKYLIINKTKFQEEYQIEDYLVTIIEIDYWINLKKKRKYHHINYMI
jgi:hypothetical protein